MLSKEKAFYKICRHGPICTYRWFGRYAQCQHIEFARSLGVRLLPTLYAITIVPGSMPRGRPKNESKVTAKAKMLTRENKALPVTGEAKPLRGRPKGRPEGSRKVALKAETSGERKTDLAVTQCRKSRKVVR